MKKRIAKINGEYGECVLFSTNNRTACGFILFYGLGRKRELTLDRLRNAAAIVGSNRCGATVTS